MRKIIVNKWKPSTFSPDLIGVNFQFSTNYGFTIIEILVVFSLMAILSGIGFVSFAEYNKKQTVVQASNAFKLTIEQARFNSLSSVKPANCLDENSLNGYKVVVDKVGGNYWLKMICGNEDVTIQTKKLPVNVAFDAATSCVTIQYTALSGALVGSACNVLVKGFGLISTVMVDSGGNVSLQ